MVIEGLKPLAEVLRMANAGGTEADDDFSLAAQMVRHDVTHLQCTPSMVQMLVLNDKARTTLGGRNISWWAAKRCLDRWRLR